MWMELIHESIPFSRTILKLNLCLTASMWLKYLAHVLHFRTECLWHPHPPWNRVQSVFSQVDFLARHLPTWPHYNPNGVRRRGLRGWSFFTGFHWSIGRWFFPNPWIVAWIMVNSKLLVMFFISYMDPMGLYSIEYTYSFRFHFPPS